MKDGIKFGIGTVLCIVIVITDIILMSCTDMPMWAFWVILFVSFIPLLLPILSFRPAVATVEDGMLKVKGPFVDVSIPVSSITGIEFRTDF